MKQNIAFERCIDFLVRMIDKYGEELLRELEEDKENNGQEKKEENEKKLLAERECKIRNLKETIENAQKELKKLENL